MMIIIIGLIRCYTAQALTSQGPVYIDNIGRTSRPNIIKFILSNRYNKDILAHQNGRPAHFVMSFIY